MCRQHGACKNGICSIACSTVCIFARAQKNICFFFNEFLLCCFFRATDGGQPESHFEVGLSRVLLSLRKDDQESYKIHVKQTRQQIMARLDAASRESYKRASPYFLQLHMLQEVEQMRVVQEKLGRRASFGFPTPQSHSSTQSPMPSFPSLGLSSMSHSVRSPTGGMSGELPRRQSSQFMLSPQQQVQSDGFERLNRSWLLRLSRTEDSYRHREPILALRRVLFSMFNAPGCPAFLFARFWINVAVL